MAISFGILLFYFNESITSTIQLVLLFIVMAIVLPLEFLKKKWGFIYKLEPNILDRLFKQYHLIKYFVISYFMVIAIFLIFIISKGGFESQDTKWFFLILPLLVPFIIVIYYEQIQSASDI